MINKGQTVRLLRGSRASLCPLRSNKRTLRLSNGIDSMELFGETDTLLTRLSQRMETKGARMLRKSHILTVLSSDDETILSSLVKVTHVTTLFTKKKKQNKTKPNYISFGFIKKYFVELTLNAPGKRRPTESDRESQTNETLYLLRK